MSGSLLWTWQRWLVKGLCGGDVEDVVTEAVLAYPTEDKTSRASTRGALLGPEQHSPREPVAFGGAGALHLRRVACRDGAEGYEAADQIPQRKDEDAHQERVSHGAAGRGHRVPGAGAIAPASRLAKSLRLTGPTHGRAEEDVPAEVANEQGGWSQKSGTSGRKFY